MSAVYDLTESPQPRDSGALRVSGVDLLADPSGALWWDSERVLVVADLHLEKGSAYAVRGVLLPPYDTAATLEHLAAAVARLRPRAVVALGDSFHDRRGPERLAAADRERLAAIQRGRDWIWIAGNHDPEPNAGVGGRFLPELRLGDLTFRHEPREKACSGARGEIAGHLHPAARIVRRGRAVRRRCFAGDGERLVMPAFGAYAGGLNVRDRAFGSVFGGNAFVAHMLGQDRVYAVAGRSCLAD